MEDLERSVIRMEGAVERLQIAANRLGAIAEDVAVLKNQSRAQNLKEFIHYAVTSAAVAMGIKSNI